MVARAFPGLPRAVLALLIAVSTAVAADVSEPRAADPVDVKIDSVLVLQQRLLDGQARLLAVAERVDPFLDKRFSVSVNLPLLLATAGRDEQAFSASVAWFPKGSPLEVVVPIWFRRVRAGSVPLPGGGGSASVPDSDFSGLCLDLQGRLYFDPLRSGWYWAAGLRWAHLEGWRESVYDPWGGGGSGGRAVRDRLGACAGVGWRLESARFDWGWNVLLGRWFDGNQPRIENDGMLGEPLIVDVEFFKFGLLF